MKKLLVMTTVAFGVAVTLGVSAAFASVDVVLEVTNRTTGEVGTDISAAPGDRVSIQLFVTNNGEKQEIEIEVIGGVPGCIVEVEDEKNFAAGQRRQRRVQGQVPDGQTGTFFVDVTATAEDGAEGTASATVQLGMAKVSGASQGPGMLRRIFVRMIANSLLEGLMADDGPALSTFGQVKHLFR